MRPTETGGVILENGAERTAVLVGAEAREDWVTYGAVVEATVAVGETALRELQAFATAYNGRSPDQAPSDSAFAPAVEGLCMLRPVELDTVHFDGVVRALEVVRGMRPLQARKAHVSRTSAGRWLEQIQATAV